MSYYSWVIWLVMSQVSFLKLPTFDNKNQRKKLLISAPKIIKYIAYYLLMEVLDYQSNYSPIIFDANFSLGEVFWSIFSSLCAQRSTRIISYHMTHILWHGHLSYTDFRRDLLVSMFPQGRRLCKPPHKSLGKGLWNLESPDK